MLVLGRKYQLPIFASDQIAIANPLDNLDGSRKVKTLTPRYGQDAANNKNTNVEGSSIRAIAGVFAHRVESQWNQFLGLPLLATCQRPNSSRSRSAVPHRRSDASVETGRFSLSCGLGTFRERLGSASPYGPPNASHKGPLRASPATHCHRLIGSVSVIHGTTYMRRRKSLRSLCRFRSIKPLIPKLPSQRPVKYNRFSVARNDTVTSPADSCCVPTIHTPSDLETRCVSIPIVFKARM